MTDVPAEAFGGGSVSRLSVRVSEPTDRKRSVVLLRVLVAATVPARDAASVSARGADNEAARDRGTPSIPPAAGTGVKDLGLSGSSSSCGQGPVPGCPSLSNPCRPKNGEEGRDMGFRACL